MKRASAVLVVILALAVAMPLVAGDKTKCEGSGEDCLKKMKTKLAHKAWLGIEYDTTKDGRWKVAKVEPDSPAEKAGFQKGDVLLAVNGVEYSKENKKALKAAYAEFEPGSQAKYIVNRDGGKVKLAATLGSVPANVQARWIEAHMKEHHPEMKMASK